MSKIPCKITKKINPVSQFQRISVRKYVHPHLFVLKKATKVPYDPLWSIDFLLRHTFGKQG